MHILHAAPRQMHMYAQSGSFLHTHPHQLLTCLHNSNTRTGLLASYMCCGGLRERCRHGAPLELHYIPWTTDI
jgi:hypothetical protein